MLINLAIQDYAVVDQLEIDIKKVQAALLDNYKATTEDLLDRFKNLQKVTEVK